MLLAIIPSSGCTGFAVFEDAGSLLEFGRFNTKPIHTASDRAMIMALRLRGLCKEWRPGQAVIQTFGGKVRCRIKGAAPPIRQADIFVTGWLCGELHRCLGRAVEEVKEKVWTRSRSRRDWACLARARFKMCQSDREMAGEASDAIGIGLWWFAEQKIKNAAMARQGA